MLKKNPIRARRVRKRPRRCELMAAERRRPHQGSSLLVTVDIIITIIIISKCELMAVEETSEGVNILPKILRKKGVLSER